MFDTFWSDDRGEIGGAIAGMDVVVAVVVSGIAGVFLFPIAIEEIVQVDTTSWTSGAAELWDLLPMFVILALFLYFAALALYRGGGG